MIRYALKCSRGHRFESWFASSSAYETLRTAGHVTCAVCGTDEVEKALMAPAVAAADAAQTDAAPPLEPATDQPAGPAPGPLTGPQSGPLAAPTPQEAVARRLRALRAHVEANSDYVGMEFAREARAMHAGEAPERPIWGEAKPEEAKALIEDGVPVAPLPFGPPRKTN